MRLLIHVCASPLYLTGASSQAMSRGSERLGLLHLLLLFLALWVSRTYSSSLAEADTSAALVQLASFPGSAALVQQEFL